jgi:hypothetical protein
MLAAGINSPPTVYITVALVSQWYLRTRQPKWFVKYNYILGAGAYPFIGILCGTGLRSSPHSTRWRNLYRRVPLILCGGGCSGKGIPVPKMVGRKPRRELRPVRGDTVLRQRFESVPRCEVRD